MKALIFDASTLINFSMNGLLGMLVELKKIFNGKFLITEEIKYETIKRPLGIKKFSLGAMRINNLLNEKVIELPSSPENSQIEGGTRELLKLANRTFSAKNSFLHLIDKGEASCLALSEILINEGVRNVLVVDERTTRMLCEKPENLQKLLEIKLHTKVRVKKENLHEFEKFRIIRSCELAYLAYKNNLINLKNSNVLDALLYAIKYGGCSVSRNEIEILKKL